MQYLIIQLRKQFPPFPQSPFKKMICLSFGWMWIPLSFFFVSLYAKQGHMWRHPAPLECFITCPMLKSTELFKTSSLNIASCVWSYCKSVSRLLHEVTSSRLWKSLCPQPLCSERSQHALVHPRENSWIASSDLWKISLKNEWISKYVCMQHFCLVCFGGVLLF